MSTYNANFEDIGYAKWEKYYRGYIKDINYFFGLLMKTRNTRNPISYVHRI